MAMDISAGYRKNPFIRILIPFILGIVVVHFIDIRLTCLGAVCLALLLVALTYYFQFYINKAGIFASLAVFICSTLLYTSSNRHQQLPLITNTYQGIIIHPAVKKSNSYQVDCKITLINNQPTNEKARLYFFPDSSLMHTQIGDSVEFSALLRRIRNNGNPDEFDYTAYMRNLGYLYTGYVSENNFKLGSNSGHYPIRRAANLVQQKLIKQFETYNIAGNELAILAALTTGNRSLIDDELKEAYSAAGSMHILAVSGLHVGILYLVLNFIFSARFPNLIYRIFRFIIILGCLWFYAFITGLSPSVMRASLMFSLFLIANSIGRNTSSINILAASAFIILIINPLELFKAGFQFSYLAVLGILLFQPKLEAILKLKTLAPFIWLWKLTTVSISAQILTFPLALYYFHQFPAYFLITNIFVIPLVWLIILFTITLSVTGGIPILAQYIALALNGLLQINNAGIESISGLPGACIQNIPFGFIQFTITLVFLLVTCLFVINRSYKQLPSILLLYIISIVTIHTIYYYQHKNNNELIIYNTKDNLVVSIIEGRQHVILTNNINSFQESKTIKYITPFWTNQHILNHAKWIKTDSLNGTYDSNTPLKITGHKDFISILYKNHCFKIIRPNYKLKYTRSESNNTNTYVIIDKESGYPSQYQQLHETATYIYMPGTRKSQKQKWSKLANISNQGFYDLSESGALHINF